MPPPICPTTTSPSPPSGSRSTSGSRASGAAAEIEDVRRELRDRFGPLPEAAARLLDVVALRLDAKALRLERLEVRGGHALFTFAPSTPVPAQRIIDLLRLHGRRLRTVREFVLEATVRPGALAGDLEDPHPAPRRVPRADGGTPMKRARLALAGLVVADRARRVQGAGGAAPARALGQRWRAGARRARRRRFRTTRS